MIRFHCDIEGCTNSYDGDGSVGTAPGWATVQWTGERKEKDPTIQALVAGAKAAWVGGKKVKGVGENDPREAVLRAFESQGDRTVLLTCSALVCPTCLSNGLKFARFSALGY